MAGDHFLQRRPVRDQAHRFDFVRQAVIVIQLRHAFAVGVAPIFIGGRLVVDKLHGGLQGHDEDAGEGQPHATLYQVGQGDGGDTIGGGGIRFLLPQFGHGVAEVAVELEAVVGDVQVSIDDEEGGITGRVSGQRGYFGAQLLAQGGG